MRISQSLWYYSTLFLYVSVFASAWPWPRFLPDIDTLIVRQRDGGSSIPSGSGSGSVSHASATQTGSSAPTHTGSSESNTITAAPSSGSSASASSGHSGSNSGSDSTKDKPTTTYHTSYDARLPPGGVSMLTPAATIGEQYYKIGDFVTFGWNYTSLLATPTAIDILASCSANKQIYTIAVNQSISNSTQGVTWDTSSYQADNPSAPLLTEMYTLIIYDAASSISDPAQPGYLAAFNQFTFGMYTPQPYQGLDQGYVCATCSGGLSEMERNAIGFMLCMCAITVLSFSWFVGGIDIIW